MKHKKRKNKTLLLFIFLIIILIGGIFVINKNNIIDSNKKIEQKNNLRKEQTIEKNTKKETNDYSNTNNKESEPATDENKENKQEFDSNVSVSISLIGDEEISLNIGDEYTEYGAKAIDENNNDVSKYITIDNTVDTTKKGEYVVIYSIGKSSVIRTVIIK